jgi:UDP-N-acetylglucosamine transferase subunit ALG13
MIFVTVGTEQYPFNRLMNWITTLIDEGFIQEEVIVQYGACTVLPPGVRVYQSVPGDRFQALVRQARLVISHCGEGSLLCLEEIGTPYVLVPRSVRYKEHVDDHQVELAIALQEMGAPIALSPGDLVRFLDTPERTELPNLSSTWTDSLCRQLQLQFGQPIAPQPVFASLSR